MGEGVSKTDQKIPTSLKYFPSSNWMPNIFLFLVRILPFFFWDIFLLLIGTIFFFSFFPFSNWHIILFLLDFFSFSSWNFFFYVELSRILFLSLFTSGHESECSSCFMSIIFFSTAIIDRVSFVDTLVKKTSNILNILCTVTHWDFLCSDHSNLNLIRW